MKQVLALIGGMVFAVSVAFAQDQPFEAVDTDGDGMISAQEAEAAEVDISAKDTDGDGSLSQEEYAAE